MVISTAPSLPTLAGFCSAAVPRGRRSNPFVRRDWLRRSRRLGSGMSAREVARAEAIDEAEIQGLLARDDFRALVESWREFEALPPEEQTRRLVILARQATANALADWDVGAAFFVLREDKRGRDPAVTVAKGVIAAAKRQARAGTAARPARPAPAALARPERQPAEPGLRVILRGAERLRAATAAEHATRHAAAAAVANERAAAVGAAATMAAAKKALALKTGAARLPVARPARNDPARAGSAAPADRDLPRTPIAGLPRRPRAP